MEILLKIWDLVMGILLTITVPALIKYILSGMKHKKKIASATTSMLRFNIVQAHRLYSEIGSITNWQLEAVEDMYEDYKSLGGNSFVEGLMKEIRRLPKRDIRRCES